MFILKLLSTAGTRVAGYIMKGLEQGMSGRSILGVLRDEGLGYRTQNFYKDVGLVNRAIDTWDNLKFVRRDSVPSISRYLPSRTILPDRYTTTIRFEALNPDSGKWQTIHKHISHSTLRTRGELEDEAEMAWKSGPSPWEVKNLRPVAAYTYEYMGGI